MSQDLFLKEIREAFLAEATELLEKAEEHFLTLERDPTDQTTLEALLRLAHNFKGSGKAVGFDSLSHFSHEIENLLVAVRKKALPTTPEVVSLLLRCNDRLKMDLAELSLDPTVALSHDQLVEELQRAVAQREPSTELRPLAEVRPMPVVAPTKKRDSQDEAVRISLRKIDELLNNLGEQIILQSTLEQARHAYEDNKDLVLRSINQLTKLTYDIQQTAMSLRMVSMRQLFARLERVARDTAIAVGRKVDLQVSGHDQELDKTIVDALTDPLVHMMRNAVDHGIEAPAEREGAGKSATGVIRLKGYRRGGFFYIQISDDGKGLDCDRILRKAREAGLIAEGAQLSEEETYELIFHNGFSTKDAVSDVSGRGVGMNVVKETILSLKGAYQIESQLGKGTCFTIRLPLTLAVFNGIVLRVGESQYVMPNSDVDEIITYDPRSSREVNAQEKLVEIRGSALPLLDMNTLLRRKGAQVSSKHSAVKQTLILVRVNRRPYALLADEILTQQRIVYKPLGPEAQGVQEAAGATILGDGSVALILDAGRLVAKASRAA